MLRSQTPDEISASSGGNYPLHVQQTDLNGSA